MKHDTFKRAVVDALDILLYTEIDYIPSIIKVDSFYELGFFFFFGEIHTPQQIFHR